MQVSENSWSKWKIWVEEFVPVQESLFRMFCYLKDALVFWIQVNLCLHVEVYQFDKERPVFGKFSLQCITYQNGQAHFKNLAADAARFLKCVWPFWNIIYWRVKKSVWVRAV